MPTRKHALRTIPWTAFFAGLALVVLLMPISAMAAQRDGTVSFLLRPHPDIVQSHAA